METISIGIIGAGGIAAKLHLPELAELAGAEVVVLGGRRQSRLETLCRKFGVPRSTTRYDEIIADESIDAVVVALPHPLHVEWGLAALAAGKHVLMQKPLCTSLEEAAAFVEATGSTDRTVLALPHVGQPAVLLARTWVADGRLGTVSAAHARHSHGGPEVYYAGIREILEESDDGADSLWFFDADQADVGALFDMGVYAIAALVTLLGSVVTVTGRLATVAKPTRLEDTAALILEFESGALGTAETGWCDAARTGTFSVHGTEGKLVFPGNDGGLWHHRPGSTVDEDAPLISEPVDTSGIPAVNSHEHWIDCIRQGIQPPLSNVRSARHITEIMLAGLKSSRERRTVEVSSRVK